MNKITNMKTALTLAVLLHLGLFMVLIVQWQFASDEPTAQHNAPIIHAFTVTEPRSPAPRPVEVKPTPPPPIPELPQPVLKEVVKEEVVKKEVAEPLTKETKAEKKTSEPVKKVAPATPAPAKPSVAAPVSAPPATASKQDIDRYSGLIKAAIARYWLVPPNLDKNLTAIIAVRVAPGGTVLDAQVVKSSGNASLDQSALTAINKASPLPVPDDPNLFDQFRELRLTVRPEGVISQL
jgi:TonB family protein